MAGEEMAKNKSQKEKLSEMLERIRRVATDPDYRELEADIPSSAAVSHLEGVVQAAYNQ